MRHTGGLETSLPVADNLEVERGGRPGYITGVVLPVDGGLSM